MLEEIQAMLEHGKDKHCLKVHIIKYIKKYGKEEVKEILNNIKYGWSVNEYRTGTAAYIVVRMSQVTVRVVIKN